jgi:ketosteroid isomerase-like protein
MSASLVSAPVSEPARHESQLRRTVEDYRSAYQARDVEGMLALFTDDAELTVAPGTFRGKDAIRNLLDWDARLSPTATVRDAGVGVLVCGQTVVWEHVVSLTYESIPYEEEATKVFEFDDGGKIRRLRSYYDKLAIMDQIASRYPGVQGRIFRKLTGYLVAQGSKGLDASPT